MRFFIPLLALAAFVATPISQAQTSDASPSPVASPSATPKHRHAKKLAAPETTPPSADTTASASPSPAKLSRKSKKEPAAAGMATPVATVTPAVTVATAPTPVRPKTPRVPMPKTTPAPGGGNGQVWVNSESHVYHKEGSRWYGKTKSGKYMNEQDALKEGDHAAKSKE